jgi:hypothetical protein
MLRRRHRTARSGLGAALALGALALVGAGLAACSSDDATPPDVGPTGDPAITIVAPTNGTCIPIGTDPDATISVETAVTELLLRPRGACGSVVQCGHLVATVNGVANNESGGTVIEVLLRKLAVRAADLTIEVSVIDDFGDPILDKSDTPKPLKQTVLVTTRASCGDAGAAGGAGGATHSGGAGGATHTGGAGGTSAGGSGGAGTGGANVGGSGGANVGGSGGANVGGSGGANVGGSGGANVGGSGGADAG